MHMHSWPATALALLATLGAFSNAGSTSSARLDDELRELDGEWIYVEDRTAGRAPEDHGPPMSPRLRLRVDEDALVWVRSGREERMQIDGSTVETREKDNVRRNTGSWKDGLFTFDSELVLASDGSRVSLLRKEFEITPEGMLVHVSFDPPDGYHASALYRHPDDIELREPARATIDEMAWLSGAWVGARGESSVEERWSPPAGGALLGTSRTVKGGRMTGFEYLRIVERDGGLVYVAQPGGNSPTEFVLTELDGTRAVFENPRHDSPQRIAYELGAEGGLTASIGFLNGGRPQRFEFQRE